MTRGGKINFILNVFCMRYFLSIGNRTLTRSALLTSIETYEIYPKKFATSLTFARFSPIVHMYVGEIRGKK